MVKRKTSILVQWYSTHHKQILDYKGAFKTYMSDNKIKQRDRLSSQAVTAADQLIDNDANSVSFKPKEDPDTPPALQLEFEELSDEEGNTKHEGFEVGLSNFELSESTRPRAKSEDNQYTILGFLENKIRFRIMSQDFNEKVSIFDTKQ